MFAVEQYGVEDFVLDLYKDDVPMTKISQRLLQEKDIKISPLGISRWLKTQREAKSDIKSLQSKEKYDLMVLDYKKEVTNILDEVKEMKETVKLDGDLKHYDKMIGRLYQGIELLAKLSGDVKQKGGVDVNIIINELNTRAFDENRGMRNALHGFGTGDIIDVEAEIMSQDKKQEDKLRGKE